MRVCVCLPLWILITSGVIRHDVDPYDWSKKFYGFYVAAVVDINSGHSVSIYMHHGNWPNKSKLAKYKPLLHCNNHFTQL